MIFFKVKLKQLRYQLYTVWGHTVYLGFGAFYLSKTKQLASFKELEKLKSKQYLALNLAVCQLTLSAPGC